MNNRHSFSCFNLPRPSMGGALAAMALASATGAHGQNLRQCYVAEFYLEAIDPPSEAVWVPEDDPLFDTRLLPRELWEVTDAVTLDGDVVLRPGEQLMSMRSAIPTRCNLPQSRDRTIASNKRICVFDPDGDGRFDQLHSRSRGGTSWFAMAWEHPDETDGVDPVQMKQIDSSAFRGGPSINYATGHIPLRRRPRDGSPPYYEAFTLVFLYGNDGLREQMHLNEVEEEPGILAGDLVEFKGLTIRFDEIAAETTLVSYSGNFDRTIVDLPQRNTYEHRCDTTYNRFLNLPG